MYGNVVYVRLKLCLLRFYLKDIKVAERSQFWSVIPNVEPTMLQPSTGFTAISITCPCEKACTSGLMISKSILLK